MRGTLIALGIGTAAGASGGIFGIGGGVLIVPALILFMGFSQHRAQGTSLVALLAPVGLLALREFYAKGEVDVRAGLLVAAGFVVGGFFGARLAVGLSETAMRRGFAGFLILLGAWMLFQE